MKADENIDRVERIAREICRRRGLSEMPVHVSHQTASGEFEAVPSQGWELFADPIRLILDVLDIVGETKATEYRTEQERRDAGEIW